MTLEQELEECREQRNELIETAKRFLECRFKNKWGDYMFADSAVKMLTAAVSKAEGHEE
jgi:hypothetical protein